MKKGEILVCVDNDYEYLDYTIGKEYRKLKLNQINNHK